MTEPSRLTAPPPSLRLVDPGRRHAASYLEALAEGFRRGVQPAASVTRIAAIAADFERFRVGLVHPTGAIRLPDGREVPRVPSSIHWLVEGATFLGELSFRHELNDHLRRSGGHMGYGIRPSRQNQGLGKAILHLGLIKAREQGIRRTLMTAHEANIASRRIIEANGGVLDNIEEDIFGGGPICRYWITLEPIRGGSHETNPSRSVER